MYKIWRCKLQVQKPPPSRKTTKVKKNKTKVKKKPASSAAAGATAAAAAASLIAAPSSGAGAPPSSPAAEPAAPERSLPLGEYCVMYYKVSDARPIASWGNRQKFGLKSISCHVSQAQHKIEKAHDMLKSGTPEVEVKAWLTNGKKSAEDVN